MDHDPCCLLVHVGGCHAQVGPGRTEGHPCDLVGALAGAYHDLDQNQRDHGCSHHLQLCLKWLAAAWEPLVGRGQPQVQERALAQQVLVHVMAGGGRLYHHLVALAVLLEGALGQSHCGVPGLPQQCAAVVLHVALVGYAPLVRAQLVSGPCCM